MNNERVVCINEKIRESINVLNKVVSCLEDIVKEPDDGSARSMSKICFEHEIDYLKLRRLLSFQTLRTICKGQKLPEIELPELDPHEKLFREVLRIPYTINTSYPLDLNDSAEYVLNTYLREIESKILRMYFCFEGYEEFGYFKEMADSLNMSEVRVRQIKEKAIRKLQRNVNASMILKDGLCAWKLEIKKKEMVQAGYKKMYEAVLKEYGGDN